MILLLLLPRMGGCVTFPHATFLPPSTVELKLHPTHTHSFCLSSPAVSCVQRREGADFESHFSIEVLLVIKEVESSGLDDSLAWLFLFAHGELQHSLLFGHFAANFLGVDGTLVPA